MGMDENGEMLEPVKEGGTGRPSVEIDCESIDKMKIEDF